MRHAPNLKAEEFRERTGEMATRREDGFNWEAKP